MIILCNTTATRHFPLCGARLQVLVWPGRSASHDISLQPASPKVEMSQLQNIDEADDASNRLPRINVSYDSGASIV